MRNFISLKSVGAFLALFLLSFSISASGGHEESDPQHKEEVQAESSIDMSGAQAEGWEEAPIPQGLDNKRLSNYAVEKQLPQPSAEVDGGTKSLFYFLITLIVVLLLIVLGSASSLLKQLRAVAGEEGDTTDYNKLNARLLLGFLFVFFGAIIYEIAIHKKYILGDAASASGERIDTMLWTTFAITGVVFVITQILLFWFAYRYQHKEGNKALYYPENDRLEMAWTLVPALVLTVLVLFGFRIWVDTTINSRDNSKYEIEMYAYQFGWKFRYPGEDGKLGRYDYRLTNLIPDNGIVNPIGLDPKDEASKDDIVSDELILPKDVQVRIRLRSRDVLHAAHMPHFRSQMYCVPGTPTEMNITPIYTTADYRNRIGNPEFNFELACNQICGGSHYNMRREILVVTEAEYLKWMSEQKAFFTDLEESDASQISMK